MMNKIKMKKKNHNCFTLTIWDTIYFVERNQHFNDILAVQKVTDASLHSPRLAGWARPIDTDSSS